MAQYIEITHGATHIYNRKGQPIPKARGSAVVVANLMQTAIRTTPLETPKKPKNQWPIIKSLFPIGEQMNQDTHVFDSSIFTNSDNQHCLYITALPNAVAEDCANNPALKNIHQIKYLTTIEHLLFKHYSPKYHESTVIMLPQGEGVRLLHIQEHLPQSVYTVSNHPSYRSGEIAPYLTNISQAVILDPSLSWVEAMLPTTLVPYQFANLI